jgi:glycosyltransferase involved in cell wall biosynthesis
MVHALGAGRIMPIGWRRYLPWVHYGYAPRFITGLQTLIRKYDIVVINGLWSYAQFGAWRVVPKSGVAYVVFTHGMLAPWFKKKYPLKHCAKQVLWWFCIGSLLNNAYATLFTTEEEKIHARNAFRPYRVRERVVGYGTSDVMGDAREQIAAFRAAVPALANRSFFLFLSRIHLIKGCDLLIDAFAQIAGAYPEIDLVIAGPDQIGWRKKLEARAGALGVAGRIHWPGMLTGDVKWGAFRDTEAFVLPSHHENFGIVVAEAMAAAKPVLITDKVNIWREVKASGGGLVESDDAPGIARLLQRFLVLPVEKRAEMGARAREGFLKNFDLGKTVETIDRALADAIVLADKRER